ncbi:hypothetical protein BJ742DRAFT_765572 [Cladochytrium replicatum]|nr:hypothetical protein BJ742DRAFT_765572 [Cladochytrium replicatum]
MARKLEAIIADIQSNTHGEPSGTPNTPAQDLKEIKALHALACELISAQNWSTPHESDVSSEQLQAFSEWAKANSITSPKLVPKVAGSKGLGLFATENIEPTETILQVPLSAMMTASMSRHNLGKLVDAVPILQHMPSLALAVNLLRESLNPESFWAPYIHILPSAWIKLKLQPLTSLTSKYTDLAATCPCFATVVKDLKSNLRQYVIIREGLNKHKKIISLDQFTYRRFRWAVAVVMTRQNPIPNELGRPVFTLIPMYDLFNHAPGEVTTHYHGELKLSETASAGHFSAGDEVLIAYGHRPNRDLFVYSGFVDLDMQDNDSYRLWLGINPSDKYAKQKLSLLSSANLPVAGYYELRRNVKQTCVNILVFVQIFCLKAADFEGGSLDVSSIIECDETSPRYAAALRWLNARVQLLLSSFTSTLDAEDIAGVSTHRLNAVKMKIADKRLLQDVSVELDQALSAECVIDQ